MTHQASATDQLWSATRHMAHQIAELIATQPLLRWSLASIALVIIGGWVRRFVPFLGGFLRLLGNMGLMAALIGAIFTVINPAELGLTLPDQLAALLPSPEGAGQSIDGETTRIPLSPDGHFWAKAEVNGTPRRFLIDTGATLTTLSPDTAEAADVPLMPSLGRVELKTANGLTQGAMARIAQLRVGNIIARKLDVVVAPGLGDTNVLGMNFLTRLKSWRVEGKVMVLVPNHPIKTQEALSER
jgi:aspartyl protease family protein